MCYYCDSDFQKGFSDNKEKPADWYIQQLIEQLENFSEQSYQEKFKIPDAWAPSKRKLGMIDEKDENKLITMIESHYAPLLAYVSTSILLGHLFGYHQSKFKPDDSLPKALSKLRVTGIADIKLPEKYPTFLQQSTISQNGDPVSGATSIRNKVPMFRDAAKVQKKLPTVQQYAVKQAQKTAGMFYDRTIQNETNSARRAIWQHNRNVLNSKIVEHLKTDNWLDWRKLQSDLYHSLKQSDTRDWFRISATEISAAQQYGLLQSFLDEGVEELHVVVQPTACKYCKKFYEGKTFKVKDFITIPRDINWRHKVKDWVVALPPLHPHCFCKIRRGKHP